MKQTDMVEVVVESVNPGDREVGPAVILADKRGTFRIPVSLARPADRAVQAALDGKGPAQDSPHILLAKAITHLDARLKYVWSWSQWNRNLYFKLMLEQEGKEVELEASEADALALALEQHVPIYVVPEIVQAAAVRPQEPTARPAGMDDLAWEEDLNRRADGNLALGRWEEAGNAYEALAAIRPRNTDYLKHLALTLAKRRWFRKATEVLHRAIGEAVQNGNYITAQDLATDFANFKWEPLPPATVRAPEVFEDFEEAAPPKCVWISNFWEDPGRPVAAPGGRPGRAYELPFHFAHVEYPMLFLLFEEPRIWEGATALALDVYLPADQAPATPLRLRIAFGRRNGRYLRDVALKAGWNDLHLRFDSIEWMREIKKNEGVPEAVNVQRISPIDGMTFMLWGAGRKERGTIYFDNIRIKG